jgi:hypothetical protein
VTDRRANRLAPFPATALPLLKDLGYAGKILLGSDFPNIRTRTPGRSRDSPDWGSATGG